MKKNNTRVNVILTLPKETADDLKEVIANKGVPLARVVADYLSEYIKAYKSEQCIKYANLTEEQRSMRYGLIESGVDPRDVDMLTIDELQRIYNIHLQMTRAQTCSSGKN